MKKWWHSFLNPWLIIGAWLVVPLLLIVLRLADVIDSIVFKVLFVSWPFAWPWTMLRLIGAREKSKCRAIDAGLCYACGRATLEPDPDKAVTWNCTTCGARFEKYGRDKARSLRRRKM